MTAAAREVWITGVGIVSHLGEGREAHWQGLNAAPPPPDTQSFAPAIIHPMPALDFDKQIPKKSDQRQMEPWQRIGTYAAGLALDDAGAKGNSDLLSHMDMIVAAGGGERDLAVDGSILSALRSAPDPAHFLNERLMSDLRPTLFLAQLSNLLAGNISVVHGVTGSSRTFMGEEAAGFDAVRIAFARIRSGQSEITLVGGSHNAARKEMLMLYEFGGYNLRGPYRGVWERGPRGGFVLGTLGAFLVIEAADHARARGVTPLARLTAVATDGGRRAAGSTDAALEQLWQKTAASVDPRHAAFISGASGAEPVTAEERAFLQRHAPLAIRATGDHIGHAVEPQFAMNIALASLAVQHRALFPSFGSAEVERPMTEALTQAVVTGVGHWRSEAMALVESTSADSAA